MELPGMRLKAGSTSGISLDPCPSCSPIEPWTSCLCGSAVFLTCGTITMC
ncbi:hypothetical protein ACRRTK_018431 [Alexandromys fortis]